MKDYQQIIFFKGMINYFLNCLFEDKVFYWDFIFMDGLGQFRDIFVIVMVVCGIYEMFKYLLEVDFDKEIYKYVMYIMFCSLIEQYSNNEFIVGCFFLLYGVYLWYLGKGVDEGNIWGDYYYLEVLIRFYKDWEFYW